MLKFSTSCPVCGAHLNIEAQDSRRPWARVVRDLATQFNELHGDGCSFKVKGLRKLVEVEREGARGIIDGDGGSGDVYAAGRVGGYDLVIDAIDRRWPHLVG